MDQENDKVAQTLWRDAAIAALRLALIGIDHECGSWAERAICKCFDAVYTQPVIAKTGS